MPLLQMSLHASAIILFAALLRALLLHRLPKRAFVFLWLLAAARMLLPWRLPFRWGAEALLLRAFPALRSIFPSAEPAANRAIASTGMLAANDVVVRHMSEAAVAASGMGKFAAAISPWRVVWLIGLFACALALLLPHLRWRRVYARSLPLDDPSVDAWLRAHPLRLRQIRARVSDEIPTPLTCGLLRPAILLPAAFDRGDPARLSCVLAHELTHIRRLDNLAKLIFAAALCAHWFNPLAWALYLLANRDIELACDEAVLRNSDADARRDYARALLDLAVQRSGIPAPLASGFGRQTIEERIRAIMKTRQLTKIAAIAAAMLIALSALAFATGAEDGQIPTSPEIEALLFDGWEQTSVRDYAAIIAQLPEIEDPNESGLPGGYLQYIYYPLLRARLDAPQTYSGGSLDAETGEPLMNYEVTATITDPDLLTVGELRDALRGVREGLERFDCESATQEELQDYVDDLSHQWSNGGQRIAFDIHAELPGPDSPYADAQTLAQLEKYVPLGLEYDCFLGNLSLRYQGTEARAIIDPEAQITISNSAGDEGLSGQGPFLLVEYEGGEPANLRMIDAME